MGESGRRDRQCKRKPKIKCIRRTEQTQTRKVLLLFTPDCERGLPRGPAEERKRPFMSFRLVDIFDMESPTKEIEDFESNSLKYLQPEQIEKIWLRLRGL